MKIVAASRHWEKKRLCGSGGHLCYFCLYKNPSARGKKQLFTRVRALLRLEKNVYLSFSFYSRASIAIFLLRPKCRNFLTFPGACFCYILEAFLLTEMTRHNL